MSEDTKPVQDFNSTIDFVESNFHQHLPKVLETIHNCDFIAFDLEFSGVDYKPYFRSIYADTFDTRYAKYRVDVENFYPIELGLCCFTWDESENCYRSRPFNFYVCPYFHKLCNPSLAIRASTLSFLRQHHFKFGRLLSEGIPTLRKSDEEKILEYQRMSVDRYDYKDEKEHEDMTIIYNLIDEWVNELNAKASKIQSTPDECCTSFSFLLPPLNSHKRKLLYQEMGNRYSAMTLKEYPQDNDGIYSGKTKRTRITITKKPSELVLAEFSEIMHHAGVRYIVEAILENNKPLIGFQAMGDLAYMIGGLYRELPPRLTEFLQILEPLDTIIDLKTIVEIPELEDEHLSLLSLSNVYKHMHDWYYGEPDVKSALISSDTISIHDAANDAYMTGMVFLKLLYRCGFKRENILNMAYLNQQWITKEKHDFTVTQQHFLDCINTVHLYHMYHTLPLRITQYNSVVNQYKEVWNRKNTLVIEDIAPWLNTKHFSTFFKKQYGITSNIYFNWLNDSMMLLLLPSEDIAEKIYKDWYETVTSDDSENSSYSKHTVIGLSLEMPVDFCNRHVELKDLKISHFVRYEELCFVNRHHDNYKSYLETCSLSVV